MKRILPLMFAAAVTVASFATFSPKVLAQPATQPSANTEGDPVNKDQAARAKRMAERELQRAHTVRARVMGGQGNNFIWRQRGDVKKEKLAYLGVTTSPVSAAMREQLDLQRGVGLVVDFVEPDSPAAKAGVKRYDVLQKFNDQILVNQQQLRVLVRLQKPEQAVQLTVLRKGGPQTLNATLVEHEVEVDDDDMSFGVAPLPDGAPNAGVLSFTNTDYGTDAFVAQPLQKNQLMEMINDRVGDAGATGGNVNVILKDDNQSIFLESKDGKRNVRVEDKDGKELFNGPVDTEEERAKLPEGVEEKLNRMDTRLNVIGVRPGVELRLAPQIKEGFPLPGTPEAPRAKD